MKRLIAAAGAAVLLAVGLTACTGGGSSNSSCQNKIQKPDATQVTFWAWYPHFKSVVNLFNKTHDNVQICWTNAGAGGDEYTKFSTAVEAGSGAPDVVMLESDVVPSYIAQGALVDLTKYGADKVEKNYTKGSWVDVSSGGGVYAIPVDGGPVGMLYRKDIFDKYGLSVPTTWEQFAADAKKLKDAGSKAKMTDFPGNGRAFQQALFSQAGSVPFKVNGKKLSINLDDAPTKKVMDYWDGLIKKGLVGTEDMFTTDYYTHMVNGTYACVIAASWLPGNLTGFKSKNENAEWRAAPIPQWAGADPVQVNWGGSTFAVTNQAKDKKTAAKVAIETFGTMKAWKIGVEKASLFPLWKPMLQSAWFKNQQAAFYGGQQVNKEVFLNAATKYEGFVASPIQNFVYDKLQDAVNSVSKGKATVDEALTKYQNVVVKHAKSEGYTVQ